MNRIFSKELTSMIGQTVLVKGWLHNLRVLGKLAFLIMRDRDGMIQVVIEDADQISKLKELQPGSALAVKGNAVTAKNTMGVEITNAEIEILNPIHEAAPIDITKEELNADFDTLLNNRVVALRHPQQRAIFRVYAAVLAGFQNSLKSKDFVEYKSAKLMPEASEGGTNFFEVPYFNDTSVYLAQSPQFFKQIMVGVYERAFEIGPVFRAEKHNTSRHMSEYVSMDAEMGFIDSWEDVLDLIDSTVKDIVNYVWEHEAENMRFLGATKPLLAEKTPRLKITEIHELYFQETGKDLRNEPDLEPEEEKFICEYSARKWGSDLVFATHFPTKKRPFYTYPSDENPEETYSADMLFRGIEIATGGQRIHKYEQLLSNVLKWGVDPEKIRDYLAAFKYGMPPHGGFGMGSERIAAKLMGLDNVKEATLFPSDMKRAAGTKLRANTYFGGESIRDAILKRLKTSEVEFEYLQHEPTPTSEDSARVRNTTMTEGVKALIVVGKSGKNYQVNIPSNLRSDLKAVSEFVGEKVEMEKPEVIKSKFGLLVGGVPPFGNIIGITNLFDNKIRDNTRWAFNVGLSTESLVVTSSNWLETADAEWGNFTK